MVAVPVQSEKKGKSNLCAKELTVQKESGDEHRQEAGVPAEHSAQPKPAGNISSSCCRKWVFQGKV